MSDGDTGDRLQSLCETGQQRLMKMDYLEAEAALVEAEALALQAEDFDTLGRLYFPLQEARRQRRQMCGEGTVQLDFWATGPNQSPDPVKVVEQVPHGQVLIAGWADASPAVELRRLAAQRRLYLETYLAAVYPLTEDHSRRAIAIVPTTEVALPPAEAALGGHVEGLIRQLPPFSLVLADDEFVRGPQAGTPETFAVTMRLWEQLHTPYLNAARDVPDPRRRIEAYRRVIVIDYACEKAHQWLATTALELARQRRE